MIKQIHFLLTYTCLFECDHCFLYCGPNSTGTFTLEKLRKVYDEVAKIDTVEHVYFEGGESFLYYPLLLEGIRMAKEMDLKAGIVTNAYWATTTEDAELWLRPLLDAGLSDLSLSDDAFHHGDEEDNPAKRALAAAEKIGLPVGSICIEEPVVLGGTKDYQGKGEPVVGGGVKFRGRAIEKLAEGLPRKNWREFTECHDEDFENPVRVHIDPAGNVHFCQGLLIGNMWETPLSVLLQSYDMNSHPICGPLARGGPEALAEEHGVEHEESYIDECHFCFLVRRDLIEKFPRYLGPRQVYGLADNV
jgi:hypothetical protein